MKTRKSRPIQKMINHFGSGIKTAKALGVTYQAVSMWLNTDKRPSAYLAIKATVLSEGEIKAEDLNPQLKGWLKDYCALSER